MLDGHVGPLVWRCSVDVVEMGWPGLALVALSVVERLDAVRAVLAGGTATEVAASVGVSRQSLHAWIARYLVEGVAGLAVLVGVVAGLLSASGVDHGGGAGRGDAAGACAVGR